MKEPSMSTTVEEIAEQFAKEFSGLITQIEGQVKRSLTTEEKHFLKERMTEELDKILREECPDDVRERVMQIVRSQCEGE
jgi:hypothetical protein